jgi:hypothetical protein
MADLDLYIAGLKRGLSDGLYLGDLNFVEPTLDELNVTWPWKTLNELHMFACGIDINNLAFIPSMFHSHELYEAALNSKKKSIAGSFQNSFTNVRNINIVSIMIKNGMLRQVIALGVEYDERIVKLFEALEDTSIFDVRIRAERDGFPHLVTIPDEWKTQDVYNAIYDNRNICDTTAVHLLRQFDIKMVHTSHNSRNKWRSTLLTLHLGSILSFDLFCDEINEIVDSGGDRPCNWKYLFNLLIESYDFYHCDDDSENVIADHIHFIETDLPHLLIYINKISILTDKSDRLICQCPEIILVYHHNGVEWDVTPEFRTRCVRDCMKYPQDKYKRISPKTLVLLYDANIYDPDSNLLNIISRDIYGDVIAEHAIAIIKTWPRLAVNADATYLTNECLYEIYKTMPFVVRYLETAVSERFIRFLGTMAQ